MAETGLEGKVEQVDEEQVRKDVNACLDLLADYLGIKMPKESRPEIVLRNRENPLGTSACGEGKIIIDRRHINNGTAYFEEAAHALRQFKINEMGIALGARRHRLYKASEEFFGRLGALLGRELVCGTGLEQCFDGKSIYVCYNRDLVDVLRRKRFEIGDIILYVRAKLSESYKIIEENTAKAMSLTEQYFDGKIAQCELKDKTALLLQETLSKCSYAFVLFTQLHSDDSYARDYHEQLLNWCDAIRACYRSAVDEGFRSDGDEDIRNFAKNSLREICAGEELDTIELLSSFNQQSYHHFLGYFAAERLLMEKPKLPQNLRSDKSRRFFVGLFERSPDEIIKRYVNGTKRFDFGGSMLDYLRNLKYDLAPLQATA